MLVWVMDGLWQWCYMTISRWKESHATPETLRGSARFENLNSLASLPVKILLCHTKMMDCQCCGVLLYVGFGHGWALTMVLHDNLMLEGDSCHS